MYIYSQTSGYDDLSSVKLLHLEPLVSDHLS